MTSAFADPRWLALARESLGVREIPGPEHSPVIMGWLHRLRSWVRDDETPWCGLFVAAMLDQAGHKLPREYLRARAWLEWGVDVQRPYYGSVIVLSRGPAMGHVGFLVGFNRVGNVLVLGGNQSDQVSVAAFTVDRILGYRWPAGAALPSELAQIVASDSALSTREA